MKLAVCYARVSTQEQAEHGVSLDAQIERLNSYCSATGLQPIRIIREEPISGGKPLALRPGGSELLQILAGSEVCHVVSLKFDRLFRSTQDALAHITNWDNTGVTLHLCDMGGQNLNTASAMGRMMLTLLASFAEFERNLISERTCAALAHKKRKRQVYNQTPYGFRREDKNLVPDEQEQRVLTQIFEWRKDKQSYWQIACRLNDLGVSTKKGRKWHPETVRHIVRNDLHTQGKADNLIPWKGPDTSNGSSQPAEAKLMTDLLNGIRGMGDDSEPR